MGCDVALRADCSLRSVNGDGSLSTALNRDRPHPKSSMVPRLGISEDAAHVCNEVGTNELWISNTNNKILNFLDNFFQNKVSMLSYTSTSIGFPFQVINKLNSTSPVDPRLQPPPSAHVAVYHKYLSQNVIEKCWAPASSTTPLSLSGNGHSARRPYIVSCCFSCVFATKRPLTRGRLSASCFLHS